MTNIQITKERVKFEFGNRLAGTYILNDPFKPYLNLYTPQGDCVTSVQPIDHRHHKGLMYALRCKDLNFWEEPTGEMNCGVQDVLSTTLTDDGAGVKQNILWRHENSDPAMDTYQEQRTLSCSYDEKQLAFVWDWSITREALRDHRLIKSDWSMEDEQGKLINYHGLGIRLPRSWAFPMDGMRGCLVDGNETDYKKAHGQCSKQVTLWGSFDGHWDPPCGSVTFENNHGFTHFVLMDGFSYLSVGPSNLVEIDVTKGDLFEEKYRVIIADRKK